MKIKINLKLSRPFDLVDPSAESSCISINQESLQDIINVLSKCVQQGIDPKDALNTIELYQPFN